MPVSETEKHGVSTSGCRHNDKVENVPIKKRRFLLRSPSPPPVKTSPCAEEAADHTKCIKNSDKTDEKLGEDEDFSGISILAAAACSSSLGRDCGYAEDALGIEESSELERAHEASTNTEAHISSKGLSKEDVLNSSEMSSGATSSCISTEPVGELASISTAVNSSQKVANIGKVLEEAPLEAVSLNLSGDLSCTKEELVRILRVSSRDDRLHWDLNVVMDAWEQPFDDSNAQDVSHNLLEEPGERDNSDGVKTGGHDSQDNLETVYNLEVSEWCLLPGDPRALTSQGKENRNIEQPPVLNDKSLSSSSNRNFNVMNCIVEDTKDKHHEETVNPTDGLVAAPDGMMQVSASYNMIEPVGVSVVDGFKSNPDVPSCDLLNVGNTGASEATFGAVSTNTHISLSVSSDTLVEGEPNVGVTEDLEPLKMLHREENDMKMAELQEHTQLSISNEHGIPDTETLNSMHKRSGEFQEGYDSQYEDGELRESSGRAWEEYDREAENADYVLKCKESYNVNPNDYHGSDSGQVVDSKSGSLRVGRTVSFDDCNVDYGVYGRADVAGNNRGHDEGNQLKLSHVGEKTEELQKEKRESSKGFSDLSTRDADDNGRKDKMPSHRIDRSLDFGGSESITEPKAFRRSLQSQVEGPIERDDISRDEPVEKIDNRFDSGCMRSFERLRYSFHNQVRGRQSDSWGGSSDGRRGFRRHYSPIIRGNRKLKFNEGAVVDRDELECIDTPDNAPYSQQFDRSGAEVESCAGFNSRFKADRKFSPDRGRGFGRGRSFRYGPFGDSRGGRGRYNGPSPDETFQSSLKYRRSLSRRERSLSPFRGRGQSNIYHSRRKSPSRSRSRSPITWNSPRGRLGAGSGGGNTFLRHSSRSPNFRSEVRMPRLRSPHQQPGFGVGHAGGFRPISRNHGSPPRRWPSVRKDEMGQFREMGYKKRTPVLDRSPGGVRLRGDRGSDADSPRSLKPDGFYRIPDRIPDGGGRGVRYEENYEDRRKQYNLYCPTRHNYDDDDVNDGFSIPNSFRNRGASSFQDRGLRSINNRLSDLPRRFRGENHSFIYERDGIPNNNSKNFGLDGMDSSQNMKFDEQYRSNYAGRFSEVSGTNRGSRYENYEDRRKHYSATNIMRRNDNEDTEKRINDNENFKDTSGKGARGFDGRIGSLSTRFRENEEPVMRGQEEKMDNNPQLVAQASGENDATRVLTS